MQPYLRTDAPRADRGGVDMMNLILFILFSLLDAGIVGLCGLCYSGRETYREGMILGIHVPPEAVKNDEVRALTENYRTGFRRFQRLNLAAGVLCPAFCFLNTGAGFLVWTLWILEYCLLFPLRSIVSLRKCMQSRRNITGSGTTYIPM